MLNEVIIKEDEIISISKTDVIKVFLKALNSNGKNKVILCDLEYGLRTIPDKTGFIRGKLATKKIPESKICSVYKEGKYWKISIDVYGYENKPDKDIEELYKRLAYLYSKFYNAGYTKQIQNKKLNDWFNSLSVDYKQITSAPLGYSISDNFCYFTVNDKEVVNEVKDALLRTYCEFYKIEGWC